LEDVVWTSEKPYVIYGYAVINSYGKLTIEEGTKIYFHENSGLWAYADGLLKVYGTRENKVEFMGDRLEMDYDSLPGQWDRIWLMEATPGEDHEIQNAVIKNGFIGIQAESFLRQAENKLLLRNVEIKNMKGIGLFTRLYNVESTNNLITNCGGYCMALTWGGNYSFKHATLANYWPYSVRNTPSLFLNNFSLDTNKNPVPFNLHFDIANSIIYGNNKNEFETEMAAGADSAYFFKNCILQTSRNTTDEDYYSSVLKNEDPLFKDGRGNNFQLDALSPAIGYGDPSEGSLVPFDLLGNPRTPIPDLGVYQFIPDGD